MDEMWMRSTLKCSSFVRVLGFILEKMSAMKSLVNSELIVRTNMTQETLEGERMTAYCFCKYSSET